MKEEAGTPTFAYLNISNETQTRAVVAFALPPMPVYCQYRRSSQSDK